jgi:hypothetical protein
MLLKIGNFGKQIKLTGEDSISGAGEAYRKSVWPLSENLERIPGVK